MTTTITVFAWIGLIASGILGLVTLWFWALWLWDKCLEGLPLPDGLWRATKAAVVLRMTKNKVAYVAHYVGRELELAEKESPEFAKSLRWYRKEQS